MSAARKTTPLLEVGAAVYPHAARQQTIGGPGPRVIDAGARAEAQVGNQPADILVLAVPAGRALEALDAIGTVLAVYRG